MLSKETEKDKIAYLSWVTLMALRCGFICRPDGSNGLTLKGYGYIKSKFIWRLYNNLLVKVNKKYRETLIGILDFYSEQRLN